MIFYSLPGIAINSLNLSLSPDLSPKSDQYQFSPYNVIPSEEILGELQKWSILKKWSPTAYPMFRL